ncbi:MAG: tetratricopeptide repeat protein [Planctomycetota bacterium]
MKPESDSPGAKVFLSHSSDDQNAVEALRAALDARGIGCFVDALELRAGDALTTTLKEEVQSARAFLVVLSPAAVSSEWVRREIEWALAAEDLASETGGRYRLLPVFTGGLGPGFLGWLGRPDLLGINANQRPLPEIAGEVAQALGVLAVDARPCPAVTPLNPIAELTLDFSDLTFELKANKERARGRVRVEYQPPAGPRGAPVTHDFESPLGAIELGELRWYVETWPSWSFGEARTARATEVEAKLSTWGRALYDASLARAPAAVTDFEREAGERRVVVQVPAPADVEESTLDDAERARRVPANHATARLLALPWELLRGEHGFLFEGRHPVRVVRRLPPESARESLVLDRHILRVLLLVARTSDAGWIDPRVSLTPLVAALAPLGDRVELVVPADGSLTALDQALRQANHEERPFHVVHFDGHGVYSRDKGLGQLVFEDDADCADGKNERKTKLVDAKQIGALLRDHRIPLFVLEACQTAQADAEVSSSVAAELVAAGIGSVVAMSHSVLVETARRFVSAFYPALARGERIGTAMVEAQAALARDRDRAPAGLPRWDMQDWFVPVLFQESTGDVRLLPEAGLPQAADVELVREVARGDTPGAPGHGFVARDRELLALSRRLHRDRVVMLRGTGGLGKTALAAECALWLLDVQRVQRLAWTSVEFFGTAEAVLQALGAQVVAGFQVSRFDALDEARQEVERALRDRPSLLVVDNFETVAADPDPALVPMLVALAVVGETRLLLTGREPAPAGLGAAELHLGALRKHAGRTLVEQVLRRGEQAPMEEAGDPADGSWIDELVATVGGHARSLVLLAPKVAALGAKVTREQLAPLMAELERENPGQRQNSLLASVRLSLARLGEKQHEQVRALAVFHGAAHVSVLAHVLAVEPDDALTLCRDLVGLGLAEAEGPYLLPDPALGPAVEGELDRRQREAMEARWLAGAVAWVGFLFEQRSQDTSIAVAGVQHALGELLAVVNAVKRAAKAGAMPVESASLVTGQVEQLLGSAGNPRALALVVAARERLARQLGGSSAATFTAHRLAIERQWQAGDIAGALAGAVALHKRAHAAGPEVYEGAAYDIAVSAFLLAQVLNAVGRIDEALAAATDAEAGFRVLAKAGNTFAAGMAAKSVNARGDALTGLGRLDEAATAYERALEEAEALSDRRAVAVGRFQLGIVRMQQQRYPEAIAAFDEARRTFEDLSEPSSVAIAWHQIAMVHRRAEQHDAAERAYLQSLEIKTRLGNRAGQANTLSELGVLYATLGRWEESADHHRRAADIYTDAGDAQSEGVARNNLAEVYRRLGATEARAEILRAIELKRPFGHTAEPWTSWAILSAIEHDLNNTGAAAEARQHAIDAYAAYRRDGGFAQQRTGQLSEAILAELANGTSPKEVLAQLSNPAGAGPNIIVFLTALRAMLAGGRDPALATDTALDYHGVVELTLFLERLSGPRAR